MSDSYITSGQLAKEAGISSRSGTDLLARLEALGFNLGRDLFGGRKLPRALADAVLDARRAGKPLEVLLGNPALNSLRGNKPDALDLLVQARADLSTVRLVLAELVSSLEADGMSIQPWGGWEMVGVNNPTQGEV
jgi:hypothetical protein